MNEYLFNNQNNNNEYFLPVVDALLWRVPFKINAEFYGYRGSGISYEAQSTEPRSHTPEIGLRASDNIIIQHAYPKEDKPAEGELSEEEKRRAEDLCILLRDGEWVSYEFNVPGDAHVGVTIRAQLDGDPDAKLDVLVDGRTAATFAPKAGEWDLQEITTPALRAGRHTLRVRAKGTGRVDWLHFASAPKVPVEA